MFKNKFYNIYVYQGLMGFLKKNILVSFLAV